MLGDTRVVVDLGLDVGFARVGNSVRQLPDVLIAFGGTTRDALDEVYALVFSIIDCRKLRQIFGTRSWALEWESRSEGSVFFKVASAFVGSEGDTDR